MCGILGIAGQQLIDDSSIRKATELLSHRGPDSLKLKCWQKEALGFTRLSILDTRSIADQPMLSPGEDVALVFNGEIYNFKHLRKELASGGSEFLTTSDSEIILQSYLRTGIETTVRKLEGMFAFAILDRKNKKLFLARDRFGMKPLYYMFDKERLVFASEIKSILPFLGNRRVNFWGALNPILMTGLSPPGETIFEGIHEVSPGELFTLDINTFSLSKTKYFDLGEWVSEAEYGRLRSLKWRDLFEEYQIALSAAVEDHLQSDVPLGVLFSAGLDSSTIAAVAKKVSDRPLSLFKFRSSALDDRRYADEFKNRFACTLTEVSDLDDELIFDLPRMLFHYETINKEEGTALARVCRTSRQNGFKVLLTGDAADEVFCGYPTFVEFFVQSKIMNSRKWRKIIRLLGSIMPGINDLSLPPASLKYQFSPAYTGLLEAPLDLILHNSSRAGQWKKRLDNYSFLPDAAEQQTQAFLLDEVSYRLQRFLLRADRFGMMESIELRLPFLDHRIVKLALNTPLNYKMKFRPFVRKLPARIKFVEEKFLLRRLAKHFDVPKRILDRVKIGTPIKQRHHVKKLLEKWDYKFVPEFFSVSAPHLKQMLGSLRDETGSARFGWSVLSAEILYSLFIENKTHEQLSEKMRRTLYDA